MPRRWEGRSNAEAGAGVVREQPRVRVCYGVRPHAVEGAGVTMSHPDWQSDRETCGCMTARTTGTSHPLLSPGEGKYGFCHQEEGWKVAWRDAWCRFSCALP